MTFTSLYASMGIMEVLEMAHSGLGRVQGMFNGKPMFRISKRMEEVSVMDWETGKATRRKHYIIHLEADGLDMTQVLASLEPPAGESLKYFPPAPSLDFTDLPLSTQPPSSIPATTDAATQTAPVQHSEDLERPIPAATSTIQALRQTLSNTLKAFNPPWSGEDLKGWLSDEGLQDSAVHTEDGLNYAIQELQKRLPKAQVEAQSKAQVEREPGEEG